MNQDRHIHDFVRLDPNLLVCACSLQRKPRLRISMDSGLYLEELLRDVKQEVWDDRARAQERGEETLPYNREIRVIDQLLKEIDWTKGYFGWTDDDATTSLQPASSSA
jgi:hypothetical protein